MQRKKKLLVEFFSTFSSYLSHFTFLHNCVVNTVFYHHFKDREIHCLLISGIIKWFTQWALSVLHNSILLGPSKFGSVLSLSRLQLFTTPWTAARQASLSITNSQSLLKPMSIESVIPSNPLSYCCPLLLLPSIFYSIRVFSSELVLCIRWPKYWSFSISPSNEYSGLIFFRIDWFDLAVHRTLKSLLQRSFMGIILYDVNLSFQLSFVWC